MSLRLVEPIAARKPVDIHIAECAISLAGLWLEGRDRTLKTSVRLLLHRANEEFENSNRDNRLLFECQMLSGCLMRAIDTRDEISEHWTTAVRAIAAGITAGGFDGGKL